MKRKKLIVLICIVLCACLVFVIGWLSRSQREKEETEKDTSRQEEEVASEQEDAAEGEEQSEVEKEADYYKQIQEEDEELAKKRGNVFEVGEYQKCQGFGYQVVKLERCDSFDAVLENPEYNEAGLLFPFLHDESSYFYAEINVTNEGSSERRHYPVQINLAVVQDGHFDVEDDPEMEFDGHLIYVGGVEYDLEDEHNTYNPLVGAGETITLKLYFEAFYLKRNDLNELTYYTIDEIRDNPEYYIQVKKADGAVGIQEIRDDPYYFYFKCELTEPEE